MRLEFVPANLLLQSSLCLDDSLVSHVSCLPHDIKDIMLDEDVFLLLLVDSHPQVSALLVPETDLILIRSFPLFLNY